MEGRDIVLILHVVCGSIALLTSALAFLTQKGPKFHAKVGRAYALAMTGVGLTSIGLWLLGSSDFLLFIAFFSTYMVLVGWRLGQNRQGSVGITDQFLIGLGLIGTFGLLCIAINIAFMENRFRPITLFCDCPAGFCSDLWVIDILSTSFAEERCCTTGERKNQTAWNLYGCWNNINGHSIFTYCYRGRNSNLAVTNCDWFTANCLQFRRIED